MSVEYIVKIGSSLDVSLYNLWEAWDGHHGGNTNWIKFLKTLPNVINAKFIEDEHTILYFKSPKHITYFLLATGTV